MAEREAASKGKGVKNKGDQDAFFVIFDILMIKAFWPFGLRLRKQAAVKHWNPAPALLLQFGLSIHEKPQGTCGATRSRSARSLGSIGKALQFGGRGSL